jgi:hypothetical protein
MKREYTANNNTIKSGHSCRLSRHCENAQKGICKILKCKDYASLVEKKPTAPNLDNPEKD